MKINTKGKHSRVVPVFTTGVVLFGCVFNSVSVLKAENAQIIKIEVNQKTLREKLKESGTFAENKYSITSWANLRSSMEVARVAADNAGTPQDQLEAAYSNLQKSIDALEERKVLPDLSPSIGLSASLFATDSKGSVNNVALMWATREPQDSYELYRASGKGNDFAKIYSGQGASFDDYGLKNGTYSYKLIAYRDGKTLNSDIAQVATIKMPDGIEEYSNQTGKGASLGTPLKVGNTYYRFPGKRDGTTVNFTVETSSDGKEWKQGSIVMDKSSHPDLDDFKLEANNIFYDKKSDRIVWWAHWERSKGYGSGRALVATAKPGERFTVHHVYTPLGIQVRDMSIFRDDDGQGYLTAASNVPGQGVNATLYIFKLNADYTDVTDIVNKVMEGQRREAPSIIKVKGFYYLFSSQNAGWYPSQAAYISARSLDGRWSEPRKFGNTSTFSSQSGPVAQYRNGKVPSYFFVGHRWVRGEESSGTVVVPLQFVDGFALGDYAPTLLLDTNKDQIIPLHAGTLLSQNQPASSSISGSKDHEAGKAFDGDYATSFRSDERKWPFNVTTDLGVPSKVRNVQISWHIHNGSEAYYKYTIEGSMDGQEWNVLLDRTDDKDNKVSKTYGFSSEMLSDRPLARYVRIVVQRAVLHNNPSNWYPPTIYEVKIFGDKTQ